MRKITCQERDDMCPENMDVVSSETDILGVRHAYPYIETIWGWGTEGVVKDVRHPGVVRYDVDRLPCEHYLLEENDV